MIYQQTTALRKIAQLNKRIRIIQGGTSASKTISILQLLIDLAQSYNDLTITVGAESIPHLKKGALRDFLSIMQGHKYYNEAQFNRTDSIYTFVTGSIIEFFGVAENPGKARGPRRDVLFLNECNNIPYVVFEQMEVRTRQLVILDYNPVAEFWVHTEVIPHMEHDFVQLTYKDNEALEDSIIRSIESRKHNLNWWKVYGLGEIGVKEGQIYEGWEHIPTIPPEARLERYGLDFGYTNDPTALIAVYTWNNAYIWHELLYKPGLSNKEIANIIRKAEGLEPVKADGTYTGRTQTLTVADSAEPKSIDEIKSYGVRITGATKGQGSVNYGIQVVQDEEIMVTESSTNIIKEQRNYLWKIDKNGENLNVPEDQFNHAMDAGRYAQTDIVGHKLDPKRQPGRILY